MTSEYLVSYGCAGEFGRFRSVAAVAGLRGQHAVVQTYRGLELGTILCAAAPGHAHFLPNTTLGQLLRLAQTEDEQTFQKMHERSEGLFEDSQRLVNSLALPLTILDAEVLLDGEHAILHHLNWDHFDERDLVSELSRTHGLHVRLHTLRTKTTAHENHEDEGCGRENCGRRAGGACGSGGSCATCGVARSPDLRSYFADLREKMNAQRVPLL
jgi:cell fate regulator YaaT (PSP1 superfamily)